MKRKDILIILILLFIFIVAWIAGNIYHSIVSSTISETTGQDISPIAPDFDTQTIDELKGRQRVPPSFELGNITPTPTPIPPEILFPQGASEEGQLQLPL